MHTGSLLFYVHLAVISALHKAYNLIVKKLLIIDNYCTNLLIQFSIKINSRKLRN